MESNTIASLKSLDKDKKAEVSAATRKLIEKLKNKDNNKENINNGRDASAINTQR